MKTPCYYNHTSEIRWVEGPVKPHSLIFSDNTREDWTKEDDEELLTSTLTDKQLARKLNRSYAAIQTRRHRIKNNAHD